MKTEEGKLIAYRDVSSLGLSLLQIVHCTFHSFLESSLPCPPPTPLEVLIQALRRLPGWGSSLRSAWRFT